ncbi:hypothetical protein [Alteriqipengyuania lutimaris]|uniref:hypothetical protein n=1 Tax=Alteriqipengyuania lutimaris TaxID=1538146 RepID=UPI001CFDDD75|nr:hypothetical protein [Alteriqipengyuania lutimaris]
MLALIDDYLATTGKSARWLGIVTAKDARFVPNLRRGQQYPAHLMLALLDRLCASLSERRQQELEDIEAMETALWDGAGQNLRALRVAA